MSALIDLGAARKDALGRQPSYVTVIAGASGSGKSLSLARMAERFTRNTPTARANS